MDTQINVIMINEGFYKHGDIARGIEAFIAFNNYQPSAQLHLYGAGCGVGQDVDLWCKKSNIQAPIYFHGEVSSYELKIALNSAKVFLHTSLEKPCPTALIEAMALGVPVIAGKHRGEVSSVLKNGGGELVNVKKVNEITLALLHLALPNYHQQVSNKAREVAVQLFSDRVFNQYLNIYKQQALSA
ncbi:glycosyltransferase [Mucilaginibacter robiniae]|uniref:Glycosyltransferase n=1 Tax=Mucilaginibacter robiniae TaxID=2728022 RepID=A0A7L5DW13_9SPHI|nr:glycosyltransferase [Mucilaginibacter robiniae]QJD94418.1 glycosyltransferase [Mucilaginibacter robiniae]